MATRREKNSGKQQKRELWKKILYGVFIIGFQLAIILFYITHLSINNPIDPTDTETITIQVQKTLFGQSVRGGGRGSTAYHYYYLNIYTESEIFRIEGPRIKTEVTNPGDYNMLALNNVIQTGDTLTITYRTYYPMLIKENFVVGITEGDQVYRSLEKYNANLDSLTDDWFLLISLEVFILIPITLFILEVPQKLCQKASEHRKKKRKVQVETAK